MKVQVSLLEHVTGRSKLKTASKKWIAFNVPFGRKEKEKQFHTQAELCINWATGHVMKYDAKFALTH